MQTYAGAALAEHVIKPSIDAFNKAANGEMVIDLYTADQLVPQGELFRAVQQGTIDAAQSDDDSMAAPIDVSVFGAYFPSASRYSLDVPVLWEWYGLREIWEEAYAEIPGVTWLSAGAWDPCNFVTTKPIRSVEDPRPRSPSRPAVASSSVWRRSVTLPWKTLKLPSRPASFDGTPGVVRPSVHSWLGRHQSTTSPTTSARAGSYIVNTERWEELPEHLQQLYKLTIDLHYYRQHWYWWAKPTTVRRASC